MPTWTKPTFREIDLCAEIGLYFDEGEDPGWWDHVRMETEPAAPEPEAPRAGA